MNKQTFDLSKQNGRKHFQELLDFLYSFNEDSDNDTYYDIHIYPVDRQMIGIEWSETPWGYNKEWGGEFKWVDTYDEIYTEVQFPDNHFEMVPKGSENEVLEEWHKENPDWVLNALGLWTNEEENRVAYIYYNGEDIKNKDENINDSTFKKVICTTKVKGINELFKKVPDDVVKRTGYIVISPAVLDDYYTDYPHELELEKTNTGVHRLGRVLLKYKDNWGDETIDEENIIHIYVNFDNYDKDDYQISFITDSNYQIFKITMEETK